MITIAERFNFPPSEIKALKMSELWFWYEAAVDLYEKERAALEDK